MVGGDRPSLPHKHNVDSGSHSSCAQSWGGEGGMEPPQLFNPARPPQDPSKGSQARPMRWGAPFPPLDQLQEQQRWLLLSRYLSRGGQEREHPHTAVVAGGGHLRWGPAFSHYPLPSCGGRRQRFSFPLSDSFRGGARPVLACASTSSAAESSTGSGWNHLKLTLIAYLYTDSLRYSALEHPCMILHQMWVTFSHDQPF